MKMNMGQAPLGGGLFGNPRRQFGTNPDEMAQMRAPQIMGMDRPQPSMAPPAPQAKGDGWKRAIGIIGDALLGLGGQQGVYGPLMERRRQEEEFFKRQDAMYQRQRADGLADYRQKKLVDSEFASPEKDAFDRALVAGGIDPNSEQGIALYRQRAMTMAQGQPDEPRMVTLPDGRAIFGTMDEIRSVLGGTTAPQRPAKPVGGLMPITGGTSGNAGGSFRP